MPTLVMVDDKTNMICARVVKKKGVDEYSVKCVTKFIELLGHKRIVLKSDNEPAIKSLKDEVKRHTSVEIVNEESPVYESKSQGKCERTVQKVQEQFRAMKDGLETRLGERIDSGNPIIPWIVSHAADTINRYHIGKDGKTANEKWKGKEFKRSTPETGETVHFLRAGTKGKEKGEVRWEEGCFLGVRNESGEIIVGNEEGIVKARDYRKIADPVNRWSAKSIKDMKGSPWAPNPGTEDPDLHAHVRVPRDETPPSEFFPGLPEEKQYRRVRISPDDAKERGLWLSCPGCRAIRDNKQAMNHTEECRNSIIEEMLTKKKSAKMNMSDERATTIMAERGKRILEKEERQGKKSKTNSEMERKRPLEPESNVQVGGSSSSTQPSEQKKAKAEEERGVKRPAEQEPDDARPKDDMDTNLVSTMNLNEFDLGSSSERGRIKNLVKSKKIKLIVYNERVGRTIVNQASVDRSKNQSEAKATADQKNNQIEQFVLNLCRTQDRNGMQFAIEMKGTNGCLAKLTKEIKDLSETKGRKVNISKGTRSVTEHMKLVNNFSAECSSSLRPVYIEVKDKEITVRGLCEQEWSTKVAKESKKDDKQQGRVENRGLNLMTFAVDKEEQYWKTKMQTETFWDNVSGKQLRNEEVKKARHEEMQEVYKHLVYK